MRRKQVSWAIALLAPLVFGAGHARAADPLPVELYAKIPLAEQVRLSPDGGRLAVITSRKGADLLLVHDFKTGDRPINLGAWQAHWIDWKSPTRILTGVFQSTDALMFGQDQQTGATRLYGVDSDGSNALDIGEPADGFAFVGGASDQRIFPQYQDQTASLLDADPHHVLQTILDSVPYKRSTVAPSVWLVDVDTGERRRVLAPRNFMWDYMTDHAGVIRLAEGINGTQEVISVRDSADGNWRDLHRRNVNGDPVFDPVAFIPDAPSMLQVIGSDSAGHLGLWAFDTIKGAFDHLIDGDIATPSHLLTRGDRLVGYAAGDGTMKYLDPAWQHDADAISRALPGQRVEIVDRTADGKRVLVAATTPHAPDAWWMLDRTASPAQLTAVIETYPEIAAAGIAPVTKVVYTARDGLPIPAWLTLPKGAHGPPPFVVLPHGGPNYCDGDGFDFLAQFLASRGYGVLQPEFRGSTCQGPAFEERGYGQWGLAMQDDVTDGTHWLIEQKLADPSRIGIVGMSYGGYAALEGVVKEPQLYRCAAAWAPVTDLVRLRGDLRKTINYKAPIERLGLDTDQLSAASPALHADRIQVPVLLVHGKTDFTVQVEHSERMEAALKSAGKPIQAIYLDDSDHYMRRYEARLVWLKALEGFLMANLGKPPATL